MANLSLLGTQTRVEVPFVKVTIGDYTFGIFEKQDLKRGVDALGVYKTQRIRYPNFIQSLSVKKINGKVNRYTLNLTYPITQNDDPNFFEKVFSSVSKTRKIEFSYGDMSAPTYIYRNEEAIITNITSNFNMVGATINYVISAVSSSIKATSGYQTFPERFEKPSEVIKEILYDSRLGLLEVFPGMRDRGKVEIEGLIPGDDVAVKLLRKTQISGLDYLVYLVNNMTTSTNTLKKDKFYSMVIIDDTSGDWEGSYIKIVPVTKLKGDVDTAYEIDIGFPSKNLVTNFVVEENNNYSIFYDYHNEINNYDYAQRINDQGEIEEIYAPIIANTDRYEVYADDMTWWTKITEFPIKASITLKGLLRPAILMTHVKLGVYYFGRKHISSGLYIVTAQEDVIDTNGYRTTLSMVRVSGDDSTRFRPDDTEKTPKKRR